MSEWFSSLVSDPWASLYAHGWLLAVIAAGTVIVMLARTGRKPLPDLSPRDKRVLLVLAIGAILVLLAQELVRDVAATLFVNPDWTTNFIWWKYVGPAAALIAPFAVAAMLLRGARRDVVERVPPTSARDWTTFSSPRWLWFAAATVFVLLVVAVLAGLNSSQAADGYFRLLRPRGYEVYGDSQALQEEGMDYFGWSYSVATLAVVALAVLAFWCVLRENALRPYRHPATVGDESLFRRSISVALAALLGGAVLLTVAIVLRDMGNAGLPWGFIGQEGAEPLAIGGEFEALSRMLLAVAALLRPVALAFVLLGGTVGWLPGLIARRRQAALEAAGSLAEETGR